MNSNGRGMLDRTREVLFLTKIHAMHIYTQCNSPVDKPPKLAEA